MREYLDFAVDIARNAGNIMKKYFYYFVNYINNSAKNEKMSKKR
jgi:hypothetical protein